MAMTPPPVAEGEPNGPEEQGESEEDEGKEESKVNPESLNTRMKKMGE